MKEIAIPITPELQEICKEIVRENLTEAEWSAIESDDLFQTNSFEGGFDASANEFVFSYYGDKEYWFQLSIEKVKDIYEGKEVIVVGTLAQH